jgi:hypothetical protein
MTTPTPTPARLRARAVAFAVLATVILLGPVYGHFLASGSHRYLGWKMFSRKATDFCAVAYWTPTADGGRRPLDRFESLGYPRDRAPADLWKVRDLRAAQVIGAKMCRRLGGGVDVRVDVRCATAEGWVDAAAGEATLCR